MYFFYSLCISKYNCQMDGNTYLQIVLGFLYWYIALSVLCFSIGFTHISIAYEEIQHIIPASSWSDAQHNVIENSADRTSSPTSKTPLPRSVTRLNSHGCNKIFLINSTKLPPPSINNFLEFVFSFLYLDM